MTDNIKITYFKPYKAGVYKMGENGSPSGSGMSFSFDLGNDFGYARNFGLILYDKDSKEKRFAFSSSVRTGSLYGLCVEGIDFKDVTYNYYVDDRIIYDKYAVSFKGNKEFGTSDNGLVSANIAKGDFDFSDDVSLNIPYENLLMYGINVRSFTMHPSSKCKYKGTYEGVIEKLPYIKKLGFNCIVLMPSYEFDECLSIKEAKNPANMTEAAKNSTVNISKNEICNVNCWGFQDAYYFAPKNSYAYNDDPTVSMKSLVLAAHKLGIEVIMQFYFSPNYSSDVILDALKFWVCEYHIDGFRINGFNIPYRSILMDSVLRSSKIWFEYIPYEYEYLLNKPSIMKTVALDNGNFKNDIRRFNKGDEGLLNNFIIYSKSNPKTNAVINYVCDYDGFSLKDLYSYDRKHNEENGENNADGNDANYSWNCGIEGETKKKAINEDRLRQIKNALTYIFLSSGTPYLFGGDEFGNSRYGNNNAYCLDNEKGYVEWKDNSFSRQILNYVKELINLRMNNPYLHPKNELKNMDILSSGYPDLSYHGIDAWRPDLSYNSRILGLFYYGPCCGINDAKSIYIGINMHWENHRLGVPKLPKGYTLQKILSTSDSEGIAKENEVPIPARSIVIFEMVKVNKVENETVKTSKNNKSSSKTRS